MSDQRDRDLNERFNRATQGGMMTGTVVMYGAGPIYDPWTPKPIDISPFTPGIQPIPQGLPAPGLTISSGGPEPIEQIISRLKARIGQLCVQLAQMKGLQEELDMLKKMLAVYETPTDVQTVLPKEEP